MKNCSTRDLYIYISLQINIITVLTNVPFSKKNIVTNQKEVIVDKYWKLKVHLSILVEFKE